MISIRVFPIIIADNGKKRSTGTRYAVSDTPTARRGKPHESSAPVFSIRRQSGRYSRG
ncbi:MAG: hypothetical protein II944_06840 [Ruminobacter sp.]|nr:hypothetical protein [Ruminobacter sp.]